MFVWQETGQIFIECDATFLVATDISGTPNTELQIRGGIEDNSKIISLISQQKHKL